MGHDRKGAIKDGSNVAVPGRNVHGGGEFGSVIRKKELGGEWECAQGTDGVPPLVGATDHGNDGETRGRWRVGVPSSRGGNVCHGDPPHRGVHQEAADDHIEEVVLSPRLCTVHGRGKFHGDEPDFALVVSRRGK